MPFVQPYFHHTRYNSCPTPIKGLSFAVHPLLSSYNIHGLCFIIKALIIIQFLLSLIIVHMLVLSHQLNSYFLDGRGHILFSPHSQSSRMAMNTVGTGYLFLACLITLMVNFSCEFQISSLI